MFAAEGMKFVKQDPSTSSVFPWNPAPNRMVSDPNLFSVSNVESVLRMMQLQQEKAVVFKPYPYSPALNYETCGQPMSQLPSYAMKSRSCTEYTNDQLRAHLPSQRSKSLGSTLPAFSRKVFVGGLPINVPREYIEQMFSQFGDVMVDWPKDSAKYRENGKICPLTGYVFLVYDKEESVQRLVRRCYSEPNKDNHYWLRMESSTFQLKAAQVRPWALCNVAYIPYPKIKVDPRNTVFVGGVPRPITAKQIALILQNLFGPVIFASIDVDSDTLYPKGVARVSFADRASYFRAIMGRFVRMEKLETNKKEVEIKPYVMDSEMCDECDGARNNGQPAPYLCGHPSCLQYYCKACWVHMHSSPLRAHHTPYRAMSRKEGRVGCVTFTPSYSGSGMSTETEVNPHILAPYMMPNPFWMYQATN